LYFAYIDESGNYEIDNKKSLEYVLTAVVIHERDWVDFQKDCKNLRENVWKELNKGQKELPDLPNDFELHAKELCNRTNHFRVLEEDDKKWFNIMKQIFEKIKSLKLNIISSIIIKDEFKKEYIDVKKWAYTLLIERLQRFVESKIRKNKNEYCLVVLDSEGPNSDLEKREYIKEFIEFGTGHGWEEYPENIIETPFIVDSHIHLGVQIADAIAYVLRRYIFKIQERNPNAFFNDYCEYFLGKIGHLFYRSDRNKLRGYGVKIFPHTYEIDPIFWRIFQKEGFRKLDDFIRFSYHN